MPLANAQEVSNILYGLGKMDVIYHEELSVEIQEVISNVFIKVAWQMTL